MINDPNSLATRDFSWEKAYLLCQAAKLSYGSPRQVQRTLNDVWAMRGRVFSQGDTQGFIAVNDHVVVVSFRGTQGLGDWGDNLKIEPTEFGPLNGLAHAGFVRAWERAESIVSPILAAAEGKAIWFTGHSLGGAVALLAAAAHINLNVSGLVTFGQPRVLGEDSAVRMREIFAERYTRIVNSNDIVAKIPPGFRHTGRLYHFDRFGDLSDDLDLNEEFDLQDVTDGHGPTPLDQEEYEALLLEIERLKTQGAKQLLDGGEQLLEENGESFIFADDGSAALEGRVIGVTAHGIDQYLNRIRAMASPPEMPDMRDAVSSLRFRARPRPQGDTPVFVDLDFSEEAPFIAAVTPTEDVSEVEFMRSPLVVPDEPRQAILIRLKTSGDWSPPPGLKIGSRVERIVTAFATAADLAALADHPMVSGVEVSREAGIIELDESMDFVGGSAVHLPPLHEKGDSALVGIVDTGVDVLHEAFRDATGNATRIVAIWDQLGSGGSTPRALNASVFSQDYGRVYVKDEIDRFISDHQAGVPSHPPRLRDPDRHGRGGHGTHVAAIAAGREVGAHPSGMAPEAGIVVVMSALSQTAGNPTSIGYSVSHVDAIHFLKGVASGALPSSPTRKPIAINVSQGMNAGAHDGSTLLESAFDMLTGIGSDEGCVIVKSAGNERVQAGHASKRLFEGVDTIEWQSSTTERRMDYFEGWYNGRDDVAFRVFDPLGRATDQVSFEHPDVSAVLGGNLVELRLTKVHRDNGDHRLAITINEGVAGSANAIQDGVWRLELLGRQIRSENQMFHIWAERSRVRATRFLVQDESITLSIPGTASTVICVGASNSAMPTRMNRSSSQGLTRTGQLKPDLAAPGFEIKAAMSGQSALDAVTAKSGTSMAAPHVAGALALVLSKREKQGGPQFNAAQLRTFLTATATTLGSNHHPLAGFGILNVKALLDYF